jgi:membrane peptidoglycan carboxypeptidase
MILNILSPLRVTRIEAARMAAILAMPSKLPPYSNSEYMGKRLSVIANNLYLRGSINENSYENLTGSSPPGADSANPETSTDTDVSATPNTNQSPPTDTNQAAF